MNYISYSLYNRITGLDLWFHGLGALVSIKAPVSRSSAQVLVKIIIIKCLLSFSPMSEADAIIKSNSMESW